MPLGKEILKHLQHVVCLEIVSTKHNNLSLVPIKIRMLKRLFHEPKKEVQSDWNIIGRDWLALLHEISNVVHKKAKGSLGIGISQSMIHEIIAEKIKIKSNEINFSPFKRIMRRCENKVQLESTMS